MSRNSATRPNHSGFAAPTSSSSNHLSDFWHNPQTSYSSTPNYDRGTSVGYPSFSGIGVNSSYIGESTAYNGYQWQHHAIPPPGLGLVPLLMPSPSAPASSQVIFAPQSTNQPTSIALQSHFPFPPLLLHCRWVCENIPCTFTGTLKELRVHCRTSHFAGPKDAPIACKWQNCGYYKRGDRAVHVMRRDSVWRHTCEKHLFLKRGT
ncbi:hypothetical protein EV702DRAFT_518504 [Suillus placidus]|uniref:Uncharacterized protein n=1 Tax=Suillus placidus TaxID=48579 RepID=A0A9P7CZG1_9AGAM|nr:hypothetical protein EV702DRAFT_518504 [Suillus placidus]